MRKKILNFFGLFAILSASYVLLSSDVEVGVDSGPAGSGGCYNSTILQCGANYTAGSASVYVGNTGTLNLILRGLSASAGFEASGSGNYVHFTAGGEQKICEFTGAYGSPIECVTVNCSGGMSPRRCVQRQF